MLFFACELGQRVTNAYEEIDDKIDHFNWNLYPMKIQRLLPILMMNTQQRMEIMCFGSRACTRETFRKVSFQPITRINPNN